MTELDDIEAVAAEYVLGTLDGAERTAVAARRQREPALDAAIEAWERRLSPLASAVPSVAPPAELFARIEQRIDGAVAPHVIDLSRRLQRWRAAAIGLGALAASLALALGLSETVLRGEPTNFVAVLQKDAASPAFIVTVDIDSRSLTVRPVAAQAQPGKSYELWLVSDKLGPPRSLGVIGEGPFTVRPSLAKYDPSVLETATYAVSLEPAGGSRTGKPTGPVLFTGKLVQATP
jgi:anti-sigma-K factor RskA